MEHQNNQIMNNNFNNNDLEDNINSPVIINVNLQEQDQEQDLVIEFNDPQQLQDFNNEARDLSDIPEDVLQAHRHGLNLVKSENIEEQIEGLRYFRRFLSKQRITNFEISTVLRVGILPISKEILMEVESHSDKVFETLWILTNIASGNCDLCMEIIQAGLIPLIANYLGDQRPDIVDQAIWAFGNIVGDGVIARNAVLSEGDVFKKICGFLSSDILNIRRNAAWTMANFFRFKPRPNIGYALTAIPHLVTALQSEQDEMADIDLCWAMAYLSDDADEGNPRIQALCDSGVIPTLMSRMTQGQTAVRVPSLRSLGNICTGTDTQTQMAVDGGVLQALYRVLTDSSSSKTMRKESCWTLSNIAAGTHAQKLILLDFVSPNGQKESILDVLARMLHDETLDVCKEIFWVISNVSCGDLIPKGKFRSEKLVPALSAALDNHGADGNVRCNMGVRALLSLLCYGKKDLLRVDRELYSMLSTDSKQLVDDVLSEIRSQRQELVETVETLPGWEKLPTEILGSIASILFVVD